jgi:hypothetical protein
VKHECSAATRVMSTCTLLLPQNVRLGQSAHSGKWVVVYDDCFGSILNLPDPEEDGDSWELDHSNGLAFFANDHESLWFSEHSAVSVYVDTIDRYAVNKDTGKQKSFTQLVRTHAVVDVSITIPENAPSEVNIGFAVFSQSVNGCRVYPDIYSVYNGLGLTMYPGKAASWWSKRKGAFEKASQEFGLGAHAIRHSIPQRETDAARFPNNCTAFNAPSIHVVLAMFARMVFSHSVSKNALSDQLNGTKIRNFLRSLIGANTRDCWNLELCLDADAQWLYDGGLAGKRPVVLCVRAGSVDLMPWHLAMSDILVWNGVVGLFEGSDRISVMGLLERVVSLPWLLKQVVWGLGSEIDGVIAQAFVASMAKDSDPGDVHVALQRRDVLGGSHLHTCQELGKYMKKGFRAMQNAQFMCAAPDASKIGNHGKIICPLGNNSSQMTMWACPQETFHHHAICHLIL